MPADRQLGNVVGRAHSPGMLTRKNIVTERREEAAIMSILSYGNVVIISVVQCQRLVVTQYDSSHLSITCKPRSIFLAFFFFFFFNFKKHSTSQNTNGFFFRLLGCHPLVILLNRQKYFSQAYFFRWPLS